MDLEQLILQPESRRDERWELEFLDAILLAKVQIREDRPQAGPDGMPYLLVHTGSQAQEPFRQVLDWLKPRAVGLVVNAHKMVPDYIFTYGMIWNYFETGRFVMPRSSLKSGEVVYGPGEGTITGAPSEKFLPPYVRQILRGFLTANGYPDPKVLVVSQADYQNPDLIFSLDSLNGVSGKTRKELAEQLSWFLPLHYSLVFADEKDWPRFYAL